MAILAKKPRKNSILRANNGYPKEISQSVRLTCKTGHSLPLEAILDFQGDLKSLTEKEFAKLKSSIIKYGLSFPSFIWKQSNKNWCLDGHQRARVLREMKKEGWHVPAIPIVYVDAKDEKEAKEKVLLLSSQFGHYTEESLHEFIEISQLDFGELSSVIDLPQIDLKHFARNFYEDQIEEGPEPQFDKAAELRIKYGVELGQVWQLGYHRLMCGDATNDVCRVQLLDGRCPKYGLHDPPYGINVVGKTATDGGDKPFGKDRIGFDGIVKANWYSAIVGDDKSFEPTYLLDLSDFCFLWGANYYADKLPPMKGWIVWDKKGRDEWRDTFSDCELAWTNLKIVTRIFRHIWLGMVQEGEREKRVHPTQKPIALYQKIMTELFTEDGDVLDLYLGSGPTLIACERLNRRCFGMEISPEYVALSIQRWVDLTGKEPKKIE